MFIKEQCQGEERVISLQSWLDGGGGHFVLEGGGGKQGLTLKKTGGNLERVHKTANFPTGNLILMQ